MSKTTEEEITERKERENEKFLDILNQYFRYKDNYKSVIKKEKKKFHK